MPLRKKVRDSAFNLARHDLAIFLEEHEDELLAIFREEMQRMDDELPDEKVFIDLNLVGLGDVMVKAVLRALRRFLTEENAKSSKSTVVEVQPVENVPSWRRQSP